MSFFSELVVVEMGPFTLSIRQQVIIDTNLRNCSLFDDQFTKSHGTFLFSVLVIQINQREILCNTQILKEQTLSVFYWYTVMKIASR